MRNWRRSTDLASALAVALGLWLAACGTSNNGNPDGGDGGDGNTGTSCGELRCISAETCVNDSVCVSTPDQGSEGCEETQPGLYTCAGAADLTCHNLEPCTADADCPLDAAGVRLTCRDGFCGVTVPISAMLPATVTFVGCVDAFGINQNTVGMRLAVYTADQDPTKTSGMDVEVEEDRTQCTSYGAFSVEGVPTNTPLIVKTYHEQDKFVTTYKYNVVLWADLATDPGGGGAWVFDARGTKLDPRTGEEISLQPWRGYAISASTFSVILLAMGLSDLPAGHGAVAGTARDCAYRELKNARCGFVDKPAQLTYFNNAENPRPDRSQKATHVNGLYAAVDLPAGEHRMSCLAQDDSGAQIPLGEYTFEIFPEGVTILSFDWFPGIP